MATGRLPDPNTAPVTAKGDLYTYSTVPAKLAVGNNGETLVADSSTTTGLRYNPQNALANPIINGGMDIWQRGTSTSTSQTFAADRWQAYLGTGTGTWSRQSVSDSTNLPNIQYCLRAQRNSGQTTTSILYIWSNLETVNCIPFAGKTITFSFYARAGANYSSAGNALTLTMRTGTGTDQNAWLAGYTGQVDLISYTPTLTTSWQRFAVTATIGSTVTEMSPAFSYTPSGTAGANDYFEVTGVQIDLGTYTASTAPSFRRSGGTLAGELAACQRYFWKQGGGHNTVYGLGQGQNTENVYAQVNLPVNMRTKTMVLGYSNLRLSDFVAAITPTAIAIYTTTGGAGSVATNNLVQLHCSGLPGNAVAHRPYTLQNADNTAGYLQFDAEL